MPPSLVLVIATVAYVAAGASVPPTDSATSAPCAILEDRCQCTPDLQEFVCRTAGFTEVPPNLPYSITQLWVPTYPTCGTVSDVVSLRLWPYTVTVAVNSPVPKIGVIKECEWNNNFIEK
jgi:hypothetical protein